MPGNNPNYVNTSENNNASNPGNVNGSVKSRLTIKIPNSNSNNFNSNTITNTNNTNSQRLRREAATIKVTDTVKKLIAALNANDGNDAVLYSNKLQGDIDEFYHVVENNSNSGDYQGFIIKLNKLVDAALEQYEERNPEPMNAKTTAPETMLNTFNKLKVKPNTRKARKNKSRKNK